MLGKFSYTYTCIIIYTNEYIYIYIYYTCKAYTNICNLKLSINTRNISTKYVSNHERHQVNIALHSIRLIMETVILCNSRHSND